MEASREGSGFAAFFTEKGKKEEEDECNMCMYVWCMMDGELKEVGWVGSADREMGLGIKLIKRGIGLGIGY